MERRGPSGCQPDGRRRKPASEAAVIGMARGREAAGAKGILSGRSVRPGPLQSCEGTAAREWVYRPIELDKAGDGGW